VNRKNIHEVSALLRSLRQRKHEERYEEILKAEREHPAFGYTLWTL
jgi:hypothetical protein